jgi:excisionase family DNA binding protein
VTDDTTPIPEEVESALDESLRGKLNLDLYSIVDLCKRLDIHKVTLMQAIKLGKLRAIRFGGAAGFRFFHEDVVDWLDGLETMQRKKERIAGLKVRLV